MKEITRRPRLRGSRSAILGIAAIVVAGLVVPVSPAGADIRWNPGSPYYPLAGMQGAERWCSPIPDCGWPQTPSNTTSFNLNLTAWYPNYFDTRPWGPGGYATGWARTKYSGTYLGNSYEARIDCIAVPWSVGGWGVLTVGEYQLKDAGGWGGYDLRFRCTSAWYYQSANAPGGSKSEAHGNVTWLVKQKTLGSTTALGKVYVSDPNGYAKKTFTASVANTYRLPVEICKWVDGYQAPCDY